MNAGEIAFFPSRWTGSYNDPSVYLDDIWHSKSPVNRAKWKNDAYDALMSISGKPADALQATRSPQ